MPAREPLSAAKIKAIREQRATRLMRMLPVGLGVAESTIAFLCGGGDEEEEEGEGEMQRVVVVASCLFSLSSMGGGRKRVLLR